MNGRKVRKRIITKSSSDKKSKNIKKCFEKNILENKNTEFMKDSSEEQSFTKHSTPYKTNTYNKYTEIENADSSKDSVIANIPCIIPNDCKINKKKYYNESALRRSQRNKIHPLETWRNEYRVFRWRDGQVVDIEYNKGSPADTSVLDRISKRMTRPILKSKSSPSRKFKLKKEEKSLHEKVENLKMEDTKNNLNFKMEDSKSNLKKVRKILDKISAFNPITFKDEFMYLHRPWETLLWSIPADQDQCDVSYTMTKCMSSEQISFGYLDIGVSKIKKYQYSPNDNITFNIIQGTVKICIKGNAPLCLKEHDVITVPALNEYWIKNCGKINSILYFCSYKIPLTINSSTSKSSEDSD